MENMVTELDVITNYKMCMSSKYASFSGRASRGEYWKFVIFNFVLSGVLAFLVNVLSPNYYESPSFVYMICKYGLALYNLVVIIPSISVTCRRLHDINLSGWYQFLPWSASIVSTIVFVFLAFYTGYFLFITLMIIVNIGIIIWFFIKLIQKGDEGENRFGSVPNYYEYRKY